MLKQNKVWEKTFDRQPFLVLQYFLRKYNKMAEFFEYQNTFYTRRSILYFLNLESFYMEKML